ncbi:unnamed protein product [Urochloa decumbens]|uniref:TF-B3 domain-containing protein n=1 Tax=Urochloa decumbens TaxID=240449 RepID=A0ABC8YLX4_9POAL
MRQQFDTEGYAMKNYLYGLQYLAPSKSIFKDEKLCFHMAGRDCWKNMSCSFCKTYLDHLDEKMKGFFTHTNSNSKHGMTIIQIFGSPCCGKDSSCAGTKSTSNVREGSANSAPTLSSSHNGATYSTASESPRGHRESSSHHNKMAKKPVASSLYEESGRCYLTAEQEEKIAALVKKIQSEIPVLVAQLKKSNVKRINPNLVISKGYAAEHLPQKSQMITLERPGGKKWHPRLHVRPDGRGYMLTTHWPNFVLDNHLQANDICIFQPTMSEKRFKMMVHLLRESSSRSLGRHANGLNSHVKKELTSTVDVNEKSSRENSRSSDRHERVLTDSGGPSKPPLYVALSGTCLTPAQEKIVKGKVTAIKPEVPIFVVTIDKNIVGCNDAFIIDFSHAAQYLPDGKQVLTLRRRSRVWRTNLHNRLMLATGEWREFARDSRLEEGDLCLFEPMKKERLAMVVHTIRRDQYT